MGNTKAKNNSNKPKQTAKTVTSVKKQNTVEYVIVNILCLVHIHSICRHKLPELVQTSVFLIRQITAGNNFVSDG